MDGPRAAPGLARAPRSAGPAPHPLPPAAPSPSPSSLLSAGRRSAKTNACSSSAAASSRRALLPSRHDAAHNSSNRSQLRPAALAAPRALGSAPARGGDRGSSSGGGRRGAAVVARFRERGDDADVSADEAPAAAGPRKNAEKQGGSSRVDGGGSTNGSTAAEAQAEAEQQAEGEAAAVAARRAEWLSQQLQPWTRLAEGLPPAPHWFAGDPPSAVPSPPPALSSSTALTRGAMQPHGGQNGALPQPDRAAASGDAGVRAAGDVGEGSVSMRAVGLGVDTTGDDQGSGGDAMGTRSGGGAEEGGAGHWVENGGARGKGADPPPEAEAEAEAEAAPTALSGEELLEAAPATPLVLAADVEGKVAEIIARYRLMDDRMAAVERELVELSRELRTAPPGVVLAASTVPTRPSPPPDTAHHDGSAPPPTAAATAAAAPAAPYPHGSAVAAEAGDVAAAAGSGGPGSRTPQGATPKGQAAAADLLSGGGSQAEGKHRLFEINRIQSAITEVANSGYLESVKALRETLLVQEWGLQAKTWARRRGVSAFEQWAAQHNDPDISYEHISALYDDPDALHVLPTPRLRMMARALIEQQTLQAYDETFKRCTATAEGLARVGLADLLPHTAGVGQVLRGVLPSGLPFLTWGFWSKGFAKLWPFGRRGAKTATFCASRLLACFKDVPPSAGPQRVTTELSLSAAGLSEDVARSVIDVFPGLTSLTLRCAEALDEHSAAALSLLLGTGEAGEGPLPLPNLRALLVQCSPRRLLPAPSAPTASLKGATQLTSLQLDFALNQEADAQALASLTGLARLVVGSLASELMVEALSPLTGLTVLDLGKTPGPLPVPALLGMAGLECLSARRASLDASALAALSGLVWLSLDKLTMPGVATGAGAGAGAAAGLTSRRWQLPPQLSELYLGSQPPEVLCGLRDPPAKPLAGCRILIGLLAGQHIADGALLPAAEEALCGAAEALTGHLGDNARVSLSAAIAQPLQPVGGEAGLGRRNHGRWLRALAGTGLGSLSFWHIALSHQDMGTIVGTCTSLKRLALNDRCTFPVSMLPQLSRLPRLETVVLDVSAWCGPNARGPLRVPMGARGSLLALCSSPGFQSRMGRVQLSYPTSFAEATKSALRAMLGEIVFFSAGIAHADRLKLLRPFKEACASAPSSTQWLLSRTGSICTVTAEAIAAAFPSLQRLTLFSLQRTHDAPTPAALSLLLGTGATGASLLPLLDSLSLLPPPDVPETTLAPAAFLTCLRGAVQLTKLAICFSVVDVAAVQALASLTGLRSLHLPAGLTELQLRYQPPRALCALHTPPTGQVHRECQVQLVLQEGDFEPDTGHLLPAGEDALCRAAVFLHRFARGGVRLMSVASLSEQSLKPVGGEAGPGRRNHLRWLRALRLTAPAELLLWGIALSYQDLEEIGGLYDGLQKLGIRHHSTFAATALPRLARLSRLRQLDIHLDAWCGPGLDGPVRVPLGAPGALLALCGSPGFKGCITLRAPAQLPPEEPSNGSSSGAARRSDASRPGPSSLSDAAAGGASAAAPDADTDAAAEAVARRVVAALEARLGPLTEALTAVTQRLDAAPHASPAVSSTALAELGARLAAAEAAAEAARKAADTAEVRLG
ncbi:hypothetical protein HYH03_008055 [Edaphochlamys debaryana]|uniref:Uncharacterized protein n=1 Tax=Edaphochlamys debaryana TaxID=47281 RepID=A0A835Y380_9CHLO|nr:hypothetical protein HYH03_008055 [Edaphochlamys debaryana]|eukprot:KAG2493838.1 hypothetical protein HYH03_008055 [Edaphochlamys debaryana]